MSERIDQLTDKVISTFKDNLNQTAAAAITPQELDSLRMLVREALTKHASSVAEDLRQVMSKLKGDIDKPEIGL
jgi:tagatose-1,6-bisphosphate aldolase